MKFCIIVLIFFMLNSRLVLAEGYPVYPVTPSFPSNPYIYGGMGGGYGGAGAGIGIGGYPGMEMGGAGGAYSFQTPGNQSMPVYDSGLGAQAPTQYQAVKADSRCPLLTASGKADQDIFTELRNFLSTASSNPKCSLRNDMQPGSPNISLLENMLGADSSSSAGVKCYTKNVELIGQRNMAYYYAEKNMSQNYGSAFSSCLELSHLDMKRECISKKYDGILEEHKLVCREMTVPKEVQQQVNKGLVGLEQLLTKAIASKEDCGFNSQDLFKVTMNTFLKAKSLSVVGPWGALAGVGADLIGTLLDKLFPNDEKRAADLMNEIVSEDTFEQNACLYYNIQQKMYCEDRPVEILPPNPGCQTIAVSDDLLKLIQKFRDVKKITDTYAQPGLMPFAGPASAGWGVSGPGVPPETSTVSPEVESALLEHLDDLSQFAISNEDDLRERIKSLPKIVQSREQSKINEFLLKMKEYQAYQPSQDTNGMAGKKLISEIAQFFTNKNPEALLDLSMFILRTTPGTKLEAIKQRSIARSIEQLMSLNDQTGNENESSRTMAKYNKYKTAMATIAKAKFEMRLNKQFQEFQQQAKFVASRDKGVVKDPVAEGQLRNLIRHCGLLQEIYDPGLDGKLPSVCQKIACGEKNNYGLVFKPQKDQSNFSSFKQNYCDKSLSLQKIEGDYIRDLKNDSGASICGQKLDNFFQ